MKNACAYANANIALVKYWGKSDHGHNIPAVSSLSMTLNNLGCEVSLAPAIARDAHEVVIDGAEASESAHKRTAVFLEEVRARFPFTGYLQISSKTSVPYASGVASSAAYFASLTVALDRALDLNLSAKDLSTLARMGSGSAARSIFGGFAALHGGNHLQHEEAYAYPLPMNNHLDLHLVIALVDDQPKAISSREAMIATRESSPFFAEFIATHHQDFAHAVQALSHGEFAALGHIMEHSTLKMFATMWTAQPPIIYWQPQTLTLIETVMTLRKEHGPIAFFTMDAGPNVKICALEKICR